MKNKESKKKPIDKLNDADKKKYYVFTKMEFVKKAMIISAVLGIVTFVVGLVMKFGAVILAGAVFITLFAVCVFLHAYIKSVWEKMLRDERKATQKKAN